MLEKTGTELAELKEKIAAGKRFEDRLVLIKSLAEKFNQSAIEMKDLWKEMATLGNELLVDKWSLYGKPQH